MCLRTLVMLAFLAGVCASGTSSTSGSERTDGNQRKPTDCKRLDTVGQKLSCYGEKFDAKKLGQKDLTEAMHDIMEDMPSDSDYYSMGLEVGDIYSLVVAQQKHYRFTRSYRVPLRLNYWSHVPERVVPIGDSKRMIVYAPKSDLEIKIVDADVMVSGTKTLFNLYAIDGWQTKTNTTDCESLQSRDIIKKARSLDYVAILTPSNTYCEKVDGFQVIQGNIDGEGGRSKREFLTVNPDF